MARISSFVTSSRDTEGSPPKSRTTMLVETPSSQITGRAIRPVKSTSGARASAVPSARCNASRFAVSSPITIEI